MQDTVPAHTPRVLVTIKNYRCFAAPAQITIELGQRLTALVGPNNVGKSAALKFFYEFRSLFQSTQKVTQANVSPPPGPRYSRPREVTDLEELFCNQNTDPIEIIVENAGPDLAPLDMLQGQPWVTIRKLRYIIPRGFSSIAAELWVEDHWDRGPFQFQGDDVVRSVTYVERFLDCRLAFQACNLAADTVYIPASRNLINAGANDSYYDILVGDAFIRNWSNAAGPGLRRNNEVVASVQESIEAIFRFGRFELIPSTDQRSLQVYIDRKPYKLSELGSGISQFIMVMFSARLAGRSFVLIDEPETGLHPTLQVDFLTTLAEAAKIGTVFSTHSLGLARSTAAQIYTLSMRNDRTTLKEFDTQTNVTEFLGEMSYSGNLDLGYKKILLVEGHSEIKAIQQLLRMIRADHEITIIPLGGNTLIRADAARALVELRRLSNNLYALIDSEKKHPAAELDRSRKRFLRACDRLGVDHHVLRRRSLENYFTSEAVAKTQLGVLDARMLEPEEEVPSGWSKEQNWKTVREMTWADIASTDLAEFLLRLKQAPVK